jgi:hypothetical protein
MPSTVCPTAISARFFPRRAARRRYCADQEVPVVCDATWAPATQACRRPRLPVRVFPLRRFPPLALWPGHLPAPDARCVALGTRRIAVPIAASSLSARRGATPGMGASSATASGASTPCCALLALARSIASSTSSLCRRCAVRRQLGCAVQAPWRAAASAARLARLRPRARADRTVTSRAPALTAARLDRADTPRLAVTPDARLRLASSNTFWRRWMVRARSGTRVVR